VASSPGPDDDATGDALPAVRNLPWRDRVVARSLGVATSQTLDRAQALIDATVQLLASSETVTVQEVADRAGYSLRILYRHFSSKEDLLAAVIEDQVEKGAVVLRSILTEIEDPVERLATLVRLTIEIPATSLNLAMIKHETMLLLTQPAEVVRAQSANTEVGREAVQAAVDAGAIDPKTASHGLYSMLSLRRAYNRARLLGDDFGLPLPTVEEMVEDCLRALGVGSPPTKES
jgi:AcrR family transcriptional regulator